MKYQILATAICASQVAAQVTATNPEVSIYGCDGLSCTGSDGGLCLDGINVRGVGIAPRILQLPGSDANLTLSLIDGAPQGTISAPYKYVFNTQQLYVGAPTGTNLQDQQPGCALMFQYQAQTFPYLTGLADPNTTKCGDAFGASDITRFTNWISDFNYVSNGNDNDNDNSSNSENATVLEVSRCTALAQYFERRIGEFDDAFSGYYYENLVTVTGGAIAGPDLNTTMDTTSYDSCTPVLPREYELFGVLDAQQVLHPSSESDLGMGGRTGTTPIMTVMYGSDGNPADVQLFCMQQLAPGNKQLPKQELGYQSSAGAHTIARGGLAIAIAAGLSVVFSSLL